MRLNNSNGTRTSAEHSHISGRNVRPLCDFNPAHYQALARMGIVFDSYEINAMAAAMDAIAPSITTAGVPVPIQFLQNWLPGFVQIVTAARKIDELTGLTTVGTWSDEEIVQGVLELLGTSVPYGDYTNIPLSSWNANYERRTVVRFEEGMQVGKLEEERAGRVNLNSAASKRMAAALALEIQRNRVGFLGYNGGNNRTYGFLNDPNLPNYITVATGASSSTQWSTKTYLEISADIRFAFKTLRTQAQDAIDPTTMECTLALPTDAVDYLSVNSTFGNSVQDFLTKTWPKLRVVSAPELDFANGGANVFYLYAEKLADTSTDDGRVFGQNVPTKFLTLGVQQEVKSYKEGYSNATAGVMLKRPFAVVRFTGI